MKTSASLLYCLIALVCGLIMANGNTRVYCWFGQRCYWRTSPGRSAVLEWHVVTVAWFQSSRSCIGAPTILLRPITTALLPATDTPVAKQSISWLILMLFLSRIFLGGNWCVYCTSLFDQLHAAIRCARDEAVAQVPTRQLPCIYAGQSVKFSSQIFKPDYKEVRKHFSSN